MEIIHISLRVLSVLGGILIFWVGISLIPKRPNEIRIITKWSGDIVDYIVGNNPDDFMNIPGSKNFDSDYGNFDIIPLLEIKDPSDLTKKIKVWGKPGYELNQVPEAHVNKTRRFINEETAFEEITGYTFRGLFPFRRQRLVNWQTFKLKPTDELTPEEKANAILKGRRLSLIPGETKVQKFLPIYWEILALIKEAETGEEDETIGSTVPTATIVSPPIVSGTPVATPDEDYDEVMQVDTPLRMQLRMHNPERFLTKATSTLETALGKINVGMRDLLGVYTSSWITKTKHDDANSEFRKMIRKLNGINSNGIEPHLTNEGLAKTVGVQFTENAYLLQWDPGNEESENILKAKQGISIEKSKALQKVEIGKGIKTLGEARAHAKKKYVEAGTDPDIAVKYNGIAQHRGAFVDNSGGGKNPSGFSVDGYVDMDAVPEDDDSKSKTTKGGKK